MHLINVYHVIWGLMEVWTYMMSDSQISRFDGKGVVEGGMDGSLDIHDVRHTCMHLIPKVLSSH